MKKTSFVVLYLVFILILATPIAKAEDSPNSPVPVPAPVKKLWDTLKNKGLKKSSETDNQDEKKEKALPAKKAPSTKKDKKPGLQKKIPVEKQKAKPNFATSCTVELPITDIIGPLTLDILDRAIQKVIKENCSSLLLLINTPGGMLLTTRKIVDRILNTNFPVLCLIHPAGAHAGSAGAIIMQACHVNGAIETTNIGAATPISGGGGSMSKDLRKKLVNDTTSWLDSLTSLRNRSQKFGREIITEAKALSAKDALKEGGIDFVGKTKREFLNFAEGRKTTVKDGRKHIVKVGDIITQNQGFRYKVLSLLTSPEIVYLLFTGSLLLIYFEVTHPGLGAPGVLGALGLILAFTGMHKLNFSVAGLLLLILSVLLFLAEVFIASSGILGAGAIVSFLLGSIFLFDPAKTGGVDIPLSLIISVTLVFAVFMGIIAWLATSSLKLKKIKTLKDEFIDQKDIEVIHVNKDGCSGLVSINGESWRFNSKTPVQIKDTVKILSVHKMTLEVELQTESN